MHIENWLLLLESVLLAFTIALLLLSIKEGRARNALLLEVQKATKTLTRLEYFLVVAESMDEAKKEVLGSITGRMPHGGDIRRTREIVAAIRKAAKKGVRLRYLLPRFPDRLHIGYHYSRAGAEVRFSTCPVAHDLRYMVVDDRVVVLGVPEAVGKAEATKKGYRIVSEGLAAVLREHFESCWQKSTPYEQYMKEVLQQSGATPQSLARELSIDPQELARIVSLESPAGLQGS